MTVMGENVLFKIEVEDNPLSLLLVFDRKTDVALVPWQDAFQLADVMKQVIKDLTQEFMKIYPLVLPSVIRKEQAQVQLNHHKDLVAIIPFEWTDRIRFTSLQAFKLVMEAIRQKAQDAHLEWNKGIRFVYQKEGTLLKEIQNRLRDEVQTVR